MTKSLSGFLAFLLIPLSLANAQLQEKKYIEGRIEYFGKYLSTFPPAVEGSAGVFRMTHQLTAFIDTMKSLRKTKVLRDDEQYYDWMGQLYFFGYNLDIDSAWSKSNEFFERALEINPKSIEARMGLVSNYGNNWNPEDNSTYRNLEKGFAILMGIYRDGQDTLDRTLYHNLFMYGLSFRSKAICYDAMFKFMRYFPGDTMVGTYKNMIGTIGEDCPYMELTGDTVMYENKCVGFEVKYPADFILYREISGDEGDERGVLMLETPLTGSASGKTIRNSFAIIATPVILTTEDSLFAEFYARAEVSQDSVCTLGSRKYRSEYFSSHYGRPDEFEGIYTITEHGGYYFQIVYTATVSTFSKNLGKFISFENSLTFK